LWIKASIALINIKKLEMEIYFTPETTIEEVQLQFTLAFPNLKLGIFNDLNKDQILTADELIKNEKVRFSELGVKSSSGKLVFDSKSTILEFEKSVFEQFGIQMQVFRKSGKTWLVTTNTDSKTFAEQEAMALEMNQPIERAAPADYQEHE
jgi:hypothetical protein